MTACRVSVLMSVHNDARYLARAVESILGQTFADFEFIVVDDGSTDESLGILQSFDDPRLRLISRENRGLPVSLNEGLAAARGEYVARQDADDLSLPTRLEREVEYLDRHRAVGLVGTNYTIIDEDDVAQSTTSVFTHPDDLAVAQICSNQYGHGSVMFRRELVLGLGGYDPTVGHVEDYDLFVRIARVSKIANLAEPLYLWRRRSEGITLSNHEAQIAQAFAVRDREFGRLLADRRRFRLVTSIHPLGFQPSVGAYFTKKAMLFRDLAYLYRANGHRRRAIAMQLLALAHAPWQRQNLLRLALLFRDRTTRPLWEYEYL